MINRTARHTRLDGLEDFRIFFQVTGKSAFDHNDSFIELGAGDLILIDPTRPMTILNEKGLVHHMALLLPRRQLVSHLGFQPKGGLHRSATSANRLLLQLMVEALRDRGPSKVLPESKMQLVVYDLVAALFTPRQAEQTSTYSDRLFARICRMIEARFTDPDLIPSVVASEARISVRYLQKLFCARGTTCGHFIHSLRLDHASRLLQRRALSKSGQPLGELAFACGFLDYPHFSRRFRDRFGHSPSAHSSSALRKPTKRHSASGQTPVAVLEHGTAAMMVDRCAGFVDLLTHEAMFAGHPPARMMTAGEGRRYLVCCSPSPTVSPAP